MSKQYAHLHIMAKTSVKFQNDWPKTVGGIALTSIVDKQTDKRTNGRVTAHLYRTCVLTQVRQKNKCPPNPARVVILVSTFVQSIIKIFRRIFVLQSRDKKSNSNTRRGDNSKSKKKAQVVILVCDMLSGPVLHYHQVSSNYSKECLTYTEDTKSMHNQCQI